jgi:hypothetical protein
MPRFDNFTNQIDKLPRPTSAASFIDAASDTLMMFSPNGRQVAAAMSQDMSAFLQFMALGSPNTAMTVSTTAHKSTITIPPFMQIYHAFTTVTSPQSGGAKAAWFDIGRADTRLTQSASLITGAVGAPASGHVLEVGSKWEVSSVDIAYELETTQQYFRNFYSSSGTGAMTGGYNILMASMVK